MIPFNNRLRDILYNRNITILQFCEDTGIDRINFFYRRENRKRSRYVYMGIAYYLGMTLEELIKGTDMEDRI